MSNDLRFSPTEDEAKSILAITNELEGGVVSSYSRAWIRRRVWWILEILHGEKIDLPKLLSGRKEERTD